jgi:phage terminase large subunit
MTEPRTIRLKNDWTPRPYQMNLWRALEGGCKRAVAVWHRRSGKDSVALNWAATAMMQRVGTYFHCAPEAKHCRKITWDSIDSAGRRCIDQAFRVSYAKRLMKMKCGSSSLTARFGKRLADNYDALVGTNPVGISFSEYSLADPSLGTI